MDFGHLSDIRRVRFELAEEDPRSAGVLRRAEPGELRVWLGAPVWTPKAWVGRIYPKGTPAKDFLREYARQFGAIELNSSFYGVPAPGMLDHWRAVVPEDFRFCPKFLQDVSHGAELVSPLPLIEGFARSFERMGDRLGLSFLQLPPQLGPERARELGAALRRIPKDFPVAVEFRHPGWFDANRHLVDAAFDRLVDAGAATVITDVAGRRDVGHASLTSARVLVRFVGNDLHPTDFERVGAWVARIGRWREQGLRELYFFVHQPDNVRSPELIRALSERLAREQGIRARSWQDLPGEQFQLFA
jgi:uncharacterized protein YecE (DUF72 family)